MVLSCAMEPLRDAKMRESRRRANWCISTLDGEAVSSSSGVTVLPHRQFDPRAPAKRLVLIAGYGVREMAKPELLADIRLATRLCNKMIAMDSAPWLLAAAGVLDGRPGTIHWQELDDFRETFPNVVASSKRFVKSDKIYTCGGASTALDLILAILVEMFGPSTAMGASNMFIFDPEKAQDASDEFPKLRQSGSKTLQAAVRLISKNLETPLSASEISKNLGISSRTLNRVFAEELQITPGRFATVFRLKQAEYFARHTNLPLVQIALRCGYTSAPSLCRAYKHTFDVPLRKHVSQAE